MSKAMTPEEEGSALKELFGKRNKAEFARVYKVPGGASMISQNMSGHRPISLNAAAAYAEGLGVPVSAFSPRLATQIRATQPKSMQLLEKILQLNGVIFEPVLPGRHEVPEWLLHAKGPESRYYPDFLVARADGRKLFIELKTTPLIEGWLRAVADAHPEEFLIASEDDLHNGRLLATILCSARIQAVQPSTLAQALEVVATHLQCADELTRLQAGPLLKRMAEQPDQVYRIAQRLKSLLEAPNRPSVENRAAKASS